MFLQCLLVLFCLFRQFFLTEAFFNKIFVNSFQHAEISHAAGRLNIFFISVPVAFNQRLA